MKKVVKFGGSSLASAEQFNKVGSIIKGDPDRKYVIPSAPGKRFPKDTKVEETVRESFSKSRHPGSIRHSCRHCYQLRMCLT